MHADWMQQRRICAPFCVVADADYIGLRLVRSLGMRRGVVLYQLLAGGDDGLAAERIKLPVRDAAVAFPQAALPSHRL